MRLLLMSSWRRRKNKKKKKRRRMVSWQKNCECESVLMMWSCPRRLPACAFSCVCRLMRLSALSGLCANENLFFVMKLRVL